MRIAIKELDAKIDAGFRFDERLRELEEKAKAKIREQEEEARKRNSR